MTNYAKLSFIMIVMCIAHFGLAGNSDTKNLIGKVVPVDSYGVLFIHRVTTARRWGN